MIKVHATAEVSNPELIGDGTFVWNNTQIRENVRVGEECVIAKNVYIDHDVVIGNRVKIQNNCSVYYGVEIEDGAFIGPHVVFTNDKFPRAINPNGGLKAPTDWEMSKTLIKYGASIGANATILCGITLGKFCLIGSGSVVTKSVPDFALYLGNPAKFKAWVCKCGRILPKSGCEVCHTTMETVNANTNK